MSLRRHKASRFARIRKHRICNVFKQCVCPALKFQGKPLSRSSYISFTCHMTICTCTTACSKQTSAALSAASKKTTSRRCASSAGYRWYTYWHFKEPTVSEKTTTTIKVCYKGPASALIPALAAYCTSCKSSSTGRALAQHTWPSSCRFRPLVRSEIPKAWQMHTSHGTSFTSFTSP